MSLHDGPDSHASEGNEPRDMAESIHQAKPYEGVSTTPVHSRSCLVLRHVSQLVGLLICLPRFETADWRQMETGLTASAPVSRFTCLKGHDIHA